MCDVWFVPGIVVGFFKIGKQYDRHFSWAESYMDCNTLWQLHSCGKVSWILNEHTINLNKEYKVSSDRKGWWLGDVHLSWKKAFGRSYQNPQPSHFHWLCRFYYIRKGLYIFGPEATRPAQGILEILWRSKCRNRSNFAKKISYRGSWLHRVQKEWE